MKPIWLKLLVPFLLLLLVLAGYFWARQSSGFPTPAACVDAFYDMTLAGGSGECFASTFDKGEVEHLLKRLHDLKNWVQVGEPVIDKAKAQVEVDEGRQDGRQRVRYHLRQENGKWVIDAVDPPRRMPEHVPYGTHVSKDGS